MLRDDVPSRPSSLIEGHESRLGHDWFTRIFFLHKKTLRLLPWNRVRLEM
jgi:hypothetical protein